MGLFNKLFHTNKASPKNTLSSTMSFFFGSSMAGQNVTERTAMQNTAVYACVRVLAEGLAELPLHIYQYTSDGGKQRAINHPLYFLLHDAPNPEMTSFIFRETLMNHLLLWGNAYAQIIRNGQGQITGFYPLMPDRMESIGPLTANSITPIRRITMTTKPRTSLSKSSYYLMKYSTLQDSALMV